MQATTSTKESRLFEYLSFTKAAENVGAHIPQAPQGPRRWALQPILDARCSWGEGHIEQTGEDVIS